METATPSFRQNEFELRTEEQVEKLVGDIGRVIRNAEPARRAGLKELAERQGFEPWVQVFARTTV